MKNFKIVSNGQGGFLVLADSERFGKQAIVFEGLTYTECLQYIGQIDSEAAAKLDRRVPKAATVRTHGKLDGVMAKDLMVGDVFLKRNALISTVTSVRVRQKTTVVEYVYNFGGRDCTVYPNDRAVTMREYL